MGETRIVKRLLVILSCLLFVGQMFAAQSKPDCAAPAKCAPTGTGAQCCCDMKCCATKPQSGSQLPAIPARPVSQNQFLMVALTVLVLTPAPVEPAQHFSPTVQPASASAVPIFQRDCAILI